MFYYSKKKERIQIFIEKAKENHFRVGSLNVLEKNIDMKILYFV